MSLIFRGHQHLTQEQAWLTTQFMSLGDLSAEYFCICVQLERTGRIEVKKHLENRLQQIRSDSQKIQKRLNQKSDLEEKDFAEFFSHWIYTHLFLKLAIQPMRRKDILENYSNLDPNLIKRALDFLIQKNVLREEDGKITLGSQQIYVGPQSVHVRNHFLNWRTIALQKSQTVDLTDDFFVSYPITINRKDAEKIKELLRQFLESWKSVAHPSPAEEIYVLNIDWFAANNCG